MHAFDLSFSFSCFKHNECEQRYAKRGGSAATGIVPRIPFLTDIGAKALTNSFVPLNTCRQVSEHFVGEPVDFSRSAGNQPTIELMGLLVSGRKYDWDREILDDKNFICFINPSNAIGLRHFGGGTKRHELGAGSGD
jgi:hypothetical protein